MTEETTAIDPAVGAGEKAVKVSPLITHAPGIYYDISNEEYHSGDGISKSGLWTIYTQTPAHFKFPPEKEDSAQSRAAKDFGTAVHAAILEPEKLETLIFRGPSDRRGNKWTDAVKAYEAGLQGLPLTEDMYDRVLIIRERVHASNTLNQLLTSGDGVNEMSVYVKDEETGELKRVRADRYRRDLNLIIDIKSTESAARKAFGNSIASYGYHAQEAFYTDVFEESGLPVDGFMFLAWEKKSPFAKATFEIPPSMVEEGRAIMRKALNIYHQCRVADYWPDYPEEVQEPEFKRWHYTETEPPRDDIAA
jgi:exodeoxyribonuclease VIII